MSLNPDIFTIHNELSSLVFTVEYKLPRQRKWRYGFSMKSQAGIDLALPEWKAMLAVDSLCQSHKIKTRVV